MDSDCQKEGRGSFCGCSGTTGTCNAGGKFVQFLFPTLNFSEPYSEDQVCLHMKFRVIIAFLSGYGEDEVVADDLHIRWPNSGGPVVGNCAAPEQCLISVC